MAGTGDAGGGQGGGGRSGSAGGMTLSGWSSARARFGALGERLRGAFVAANREAGPILVRHVREAMEAVVRPELHPFTAETKGSEKPLSGGAMEAAVTWRANFLGSGGGVWVGLPAGEMATIGRVHEFGVTIEVTDRMRGYLHAQGLHLAPDTLAVVIPPRPFLRPGIERARAELRRLYRARLRRAASG